MLHCGHLMRRIPARHLPAFLWAPVLCVAALVTLNVFADNKPTPEEIIDKAKDIVGFSLIGPFEMEAQVRVATASGEQKGTYLLDWAAPDRFRGEIHLPGYDEVSVADGTKMYRKRSTNYTPLDAFRLEELMNPGEMIADFQRDSIRPQPNVTGMARTGASQLSQVSFEIARQKNVCVVIDANFYEELCIDPKYGWPLDVSRRSTADDEIIRYSDYKKVGSALLPSKRQYLDAEKPAMEAVLTRIERMHNLPANMFAPPTGAEELSWCTDEEPAEVLPFTAVLPAPPEEFQNAEILDALINADGSVHNLQFIGSDGPVADAAAPQIANLIRFTPAKCGGEPIPTEASLVIGESDAARAAFANETNIPKVGKNGYAHPNCVYCPQPAYSVEGFHKRVQGSVVLSVDVMLDGRAHNVWVLKSLGHGLDQSAAEIIRDTWRFTPASGPDGKPAAVRMLIEVDFHIY
jgi:TonB family protein